MTDCYCKPCNSNPGKVTKVTALVTMAEVYVWLAVLASITAACLSHTCHERVAVEDVVVREASSTGAGRSAKNGHKYGHIYLNKQQLDVVKTS